jgi:electron transfer flavoprotein beta subunit
MPVSMIVCVKQVMDPETPASAFKIDPETRRVVQAPGVPPVVNGFDENAVEAALRIKETVGGTITVLSVGHGFVMDVMKKPVSMGADELVLVDDPAVADLDASATAYALSEAIKKVGLPDLLLSGRQASDWDNAHVPLGLAELLDMPCVTVAQKVEVRESRVVVERVMPDGYEVVEAELPAVVTITNELGQPRYPTLRGIMGASRKTPTVWTAAELGLEASRLAPKVLITNLFVPVAQRQVELIEGENEADAGRRLALRLREDKLI